MDSILRAVFGLFFLLSAVQTASSERSFILGCHVPLDNEITDIPQSLESCSHIILSTPHPLFLPQHEQSWKNEKLTLELVREKVPDAQLILSLRTGSVNNIKEVFNGPASLTSLTYFLKSYNLESFDVAWELIQSIPDYLPLLKALKGTLNKAGFELTSTLGDGIQEAGVHAKEIMPLIDLLFLVPMGNRFYNSELPQNETFAHLEENEGELLKLVESERNKIVIGMSLEAMIWRTDSSEEFPFNTRGELETRPYVAACNETEFKPLEQQASPFFILAKGWNKWMISMDPSTIKRRVELLMLHGFAGVSLYDYEMDDHEGRCGDIKSPMTIAASESAGQEFPPLDESTSTKVCIPFLGLNAGCTETVQQDTERQTTPGSIYIPTADVMQPADEATFDQQTIRTRRSVDDLDATLFTTAMDVTASPAVEVEEFIGSGDAVKEIPHVENFPKEAEETLVTSGDESIEEFLLPSEQAEGSGETNDDLNLLSLLASTSSSSVTAGEKATEIPTSSSPVEEEAELDVSSYSASTGSFETGTEKASHETESPLITGANEEITAQYTTLSDPETVSMVTGEVSTSLPAEDAVSEVSTSVSPLLFEEEPVNETTEMNETHSPPAETEQTVGFSEDVVTENLDSSTSDASDALETSSAPDIPSTAITNLNANSEIISSDFSTTAEVWYNEHHSPSTASFLDGSASSSKEQYAVSDEADEFSGAQTAESFLYSSTATQHSTEAPITVRETLLPDYSTLPNEKITSVIPLEDLTTHLANTDYDNSHVDYTTSKVTQQSSEAPSTDKETLLPDYTTLSHEEITSVIPSEDLTTHLSNTDYDNLHGNYITSTTTQQSSEAPTTDRETLLPDYSTLSDEKITSKIPQEDITTHLADAYYDNSHVDYTTSVQTFSEESTDPHLNSKGSILDIPWWLHIATQFEIKGTTDVSSSTSPVYSSYEQDLSTEASSDSVQYEVSTEPTNEIVSTSDHEAYHSRVTAAEASEEVGAQVTTSSSSAGAASSSSRTEAPTIEDNASLPAFSPNGNCTGSLSPRPVSSSAGDVSANTVVIQLNVNGRPNRTLNHWLDSIVHFDDGKEYPGDLCSNGNSSLLVKLLLCPKAFASSIKDMVKQIVPEVVADLTGLSNSNAYLTNGDLLDVSNETIYETSQITTNNTEEESEWNETNSTESSEQIESSTYRPILTSPTTKQTTQVTRPSQHSKKWTKRTKKWSLTTTQSFEITTEKSHLEETLNPTTTERAHESEATTTTAAPTTERTTNFWQSGLGRQLMRRAGPNQETIDSIERKWRTISPNADSPSYKNLMLHSSLVKKKMTKS